VTTALITHAACLEHDTGPGHPERIARLKSVLQAMAAQEFQALSRVEAPRASLDDLRLMHHPDYIAAFFASVPTEGHEALDADTVISPGSGEASLRAAGAVMRGVDLVLAGDVKNAFCAVRPPGHHAEPDHAMGFCIFNNVAIGAAHARQAHGLQRVAVVDFDVHHGNGTQDMFARNPETFYASCHQSPLYPGTGHPYETGVAHNIVNVEMAPGSAGPEFRHAMEKTILPALEKFQPELVFISAGFDAHKDDPLAGLRYASEDFGWATAEICAVAGRICAGRVVTTLEGGYDLTALADSAAAHVRALMAA
jgi:acetoin utilization deacetylase AcuC-like enzyme